MGDERDGLSVDRLRSQVRELKAAKELYATPHERLAHVVSEVGEVAEAALRLSAAAEDEKERACEELGMEIYDVFWNLCDLAEISGVDLEGAFAEKAKLKRERSW